MQKSSHAAGDWFPISTAECIGLMLNPKTNANKAGAIGLVSEKYDDQIRSAANMEEQVREKSRECHNHKPQPFPVT